MRETQEKLEEGEEEEGANVVNTVFMKKFPWGPGKEKRKEKDVSCDEAEVGWEA